MGSNRPRSWFLNKLFPCSQPKISACPMLPWTKKCLSSTLWEEEFITEPKATQHIQVHNLVMGWSSFWEGKSQLVSNIRDDRKHFMNGCVIESWMCCIGSTSALNVQPICTSKDHNHNNKGQQSMIINGAKAAAYEDIATSVRLPEPLSISIRNTHKFRSFVWKWSQSPFALTSL